MIQHDVNDLLNQVSPEHYREFRKLYNELLGYLEREEFDKIDEFSNRIDNMMARAYFAQVALHKRMRHIKNQVGIVQKSRMHQRFREPVETIPITHPFPLKVPLPNQPDEAVDDLLSTSGSTLEKDRKIADLKADMDHYDQRNNNGFDQVIDGVSEPQSAIDIDLNPLVDGAQGRQVSGDVPKTDEVQEDGVSLRDDLEDQSLYFQQKKEGGDIARASQNKSDLNSDRPAELSKDAETKDQLTNDPPQSRKQRIWDYIDKDQSSGDIRHDL